MRLYLMFVTCLFVISDKTEMAKEKEYSHFKFGNFLKTSESKPEKN